MKVVLIICLILIFIVLGIAAAGVIQLRQEGAELVREADRFNLPVVNNMMNELSTWNYKNLKPYVDKNFIKIFPDEEFQKELDNLSVLGEVKQINYIRHAGHQRYKKWLYTVCAVNKYSVSTVFENGKGNVVFDVNHCYKNAEVIFFQVHSKDLPEPNAAQL